MSVPEQVSVLLGWEDWLAVRMELRVQANSRPGGEGTDCQCEKRASPCTPSLRFVSHREGWVPLGAWAVLDAGGTDGALCPTPQPPNLTLKMLTV